MIDPDWPKRITFRDSDVPELTEIPQADIEAERAERQRQNEENLHWLEENAGFRPLGVEW